MILTQPEVKAIKPGDTVCWHSRYWGYETGTVQKVTPGGKIVCERYTFNKYGEQYPHQAFGHHLEKLNDTVREHIKRQDLLNDVASMKQFGFQVLSTESIETILKAFSLRKELIKDKPPEPPPKRKV